MNTIALKKVTIIQELARIPEPSLDTLIRYLDALLAENHAPPQQNRSLKGIWKDAGFEKIFDLEEELRTVRYELQETILTRKV